MTLFSWSSSVALDVFVRWLQRLSFDQVHVGGMPHGLAPNESVLLVANHVSWWDGFLLRDVGRRIPGRRVHVSVMSAPELSARPFLRHVGAIGVDQSIHGVRDMCRELRRHREDSRGNLIVSYFPQGRIWPSTRRPLAFRRGIELVARVLAPVSIIPVAIAIEPLATFRPHAFVLLGEPSRVTADELRRDAVESAVERLLDRLLRYLGATGEDAARLWATRCCGVS